MADAASPLGVRAEGLGTRLLEGFWAAGAGLQNQNMPFCLKKTKICLPETYLLKRFFL